jgi:hypothetical protein
VPAERYPTTGMVGCCARAESGHTAAPPLITLMKSRRLNTPPKLRTDHSIGLSEGNGKGAKRDLMSASGSKSEILAASMAHFSDLGPRAGVGSVHPLIADIGRQRRAAFATLFK